MSKANGVIDWENYGVLLKNARLVAGHNRAGSLCDAIFEKTGMRISERMMYSIESGAQAPSADTYVAIQATLPMMCDTEYIRPIFKNQNICVAVVFFDETPDKQTI